MNRQDSISIKQAIEENGFVATTTSGMSMYPMLRHQKDCVVIKKAPASLQKYDVALYISGGRLVLHRVISVKPDIYIIRGDNCTEKEYIKPQQIIGLLDNFTRNGKTYDCKKSSSYRFYCRLWHALSFVRIPFTRLKLWIYKKAKRNSQ